MFLASALRAPPRQSTGGGSREGARTRIRNPAGAPRRRAPGYRRSATPPSPDRCRAARELPPAKGADVGSGPINDEAPCLWRRIRRSAMAPSRPTGGRAEACARGCDIPRRTPRPGAPRRSAPARGPGHELGGRRKDHRRGRDPRDGGGSRPGRAAEEEARDAAPVERLERASLPSSRSSSPRLALSWFLPEAEPPSSLQATTPAVRRWYDQHPEDSAGREGQVRVQPLQAQDGDRGSDDTRRRRVSRTLRGGKRGVGQEQLEKDFRRPAGSEAPRAPTAAQGSGARPRGRPPTSGWPIMRFKAGGIGPGPGFRPGAPRARAQRTRPVSSTRARIRIGAPLPGPGIRSRRRFPGTRARRPPRE